MCCCVDNLGMCLQVPGYRVMVKHLELLLHLGSAEDFWEHRDHLQRSNEQDNILAVLFPQLGFPGGSVIKNLPASAGGIRDEGLIPGSGRSPSEGNGYPLKYSCLENPMDRGVWQATVHRVERVKHD